MTEPRASDTAALIRLLATEGVEFIVVGMAAGSCKASLQRRRISTSCIDAPRRTSAASFRSCSESVPTIETTSQTSAYPELLPHVDTLDDGGIVLRVLDLPTLIAEKARAARPKDKLALPLLIATLEERIKRQGS